MTDAEIDQIFHANHSRNDHPWVDWRRFARAVVAHAIAGKTVVDHVDGGLVCQACAGDAPGGKCKNPKCAGFPIVRELRERQHSLKTADLPDGESMPDKAMAYTYGPATCKQCGHSWTAVWPLGADALECSRCRSTDTDRDQHIEIKCGRTGKGLCKGGAECWCITQK